VGLLGADWVVYSAGTGEDISFDVGMVKRFGCAVHAFDPTPRARDFVRRQTHLPPGFHFHPYGLWDKDVTVRFYVDDALVGTQKIARIEPIGQATVTFNYLPVGLQPGGHRVRVEADLDGNGVIDPAKGEAFVSEIFYRETAPLNTGWSVVIGIAVFVPVFLLTVALRRRERA